MIYQFGIFGNAEELVRLLPREYPRRFLDNGSFSRKDAYDLARSVMQMVYSGDITLDSSRIRKIIKGMFGEIRFVTSMDDLSDEDDITVIFNNIFLDSNNGGRCQLDHVITNNNGVYHIEIKNWSEKYYQRIGPERIFSQTKRAGDILTNELTKNIPGWSNLTHDRGMGSPPLSSIIYSMGFDIQTTPPEGICAVNSPEEVMMMIRRDTEHIPDPCLDRINAYLYSKLQGTHINR